jgi:hypothetical protein
MNMKATHAKSEKVMGVRGELYSTLLGYSNIKIK